MARNGTLIIHGSNFSVERGGVSDDEYPRYRFSVLLGSTSLVQTSFSPLRCMFCFSERMLSVIPFFLLFALSLSLYVLDDAVLSSSYSFLTFLFQGIVPFPFPHYIHYQWSLSLPLQTGIRSYTERAHKSEFDVDFHSSHAYQFELIRHYGNLLKF